MKLDEVQLTRNRAAKDDGTLPVYGCSLPEPPPSNPPLVSYARPFHGGRSGLYSCNLTALSSHSQPTDASSRGDDQAAATAAQSGGRGLANATGQTRGNELRRHVRTGTGSAEMHVRPPPTPPLDTSKTSEPSARGGFMETNFWACVCGRIYSVFGLRGSRPPESRGGGGLGRCSPQGRDRRPAHMICLRRDFYTDRQPSTCGLGDPEEWGNHPHWPGAKPPAFL